MADPEEDEAATWVVGRDGGQPRRLTNEERRTAPLTNGSWDASGAASSASIAATS